jgi:hypothetical protein
MRTLKKECIECGRALDMKWTICPYCKTRQGPQQTDAAGKGRATAPRGQV